MKNKEEDSFAKAQRKWEMALILVGILLSTVLAIMGWHLQEKGLLQ